MYGVPCCHASFLSPGSDPKLLCLDDRSGDTCFSLQILKALDSDCVCFGVGGGRIQYGSTTLFLQVSRGCLGDHRQSEGKAEQGIPGSMADAGLSATNRLSTNSGAMGCEQRPSTEERKIQTGPYKRDTPSLPPLAIMSSFDPLFIH